MGKRVLIVDDTVTVRMYEKMILASEGYEIEMASDGVDAIEKISSNRPDLVLLDIMMPRMDGIECCKTIKSNRDTRHIKIIMVTTKGEPEKAQQAFSAGCDDYMTKPINNVELISKCRTFLK
jgi:two-component system, OmpR family, alkaline phosphatase synthesis response regulator PhoP